MDARVLKEFNKIQRTKKKETLKGLAVQRFRFSKECCKAQHPIIEQYLIALLYAILGGFAIFPSLFLQFGGRILYFMSTQFEKLERVKKLKNAISEANKKAKLNDFQNENEMKSLQQELLELMEQITGEKHFIGKQKDIFAGEPFNQVIHRNLDLLTQIKYLDQREESFLFRIQAYLEFKTNVIICREDKFKRKKTKKENLDSDEPAIELPKAATVSDIAEMIGLSRINTSKIMNSLKRKEILLNPEGAGQIVENGRTVSPRTWIVNPYILINAPRKNEVKLDILTMRLFQHSLKNLTDEKGKKVKLPVRFF